jgi:hypothetical protein
MFNKETINNIDMYILTAYFIDPGLICTIGRTLSRLEHEGTGSGLFLQNGTNPIQDIIEVPLWENGTGKTKWVKGGCFRTMGESFCSHPVFLVNDNVFFVQVCTIGTTIGWIRTAPNSFQVLSCTTRVN